MTTTHLSGLILVIVSALAISGCSLFPNSQSSNISIENPPQNPSSSPSPILTQTQTSPLPLPNGNFVAFSTKHGQIVIKLYPESAPNTVKNFLTKINSGFYNNLTFHRVVPGFVAQGGDPLGNGTGGGTQVSEINAIPFKRGSVGLARGNVKSESNDSQFFICLSTEQCQHLTNEYVNFGEVVSGMDLVDQITVGDSIISFTSSTK